MSKYSYSTTHIQLLIFNYSYSTTHIQLLIFMSNYALSDESLLPHDVRLYMASDSYFLFIN